MVDSNTIEGTVREAAGRVQEPLGNAIGDSETRMRGMANRGYGQAQQLAGQTADVIREQPITATLSVALAALVVGYLLGRMAS
jgi:uncharacterized protein YjbJ (UPF0337 family)